jgi:hypothetical protein
VDAVYGDRHQYRHTGRVLTATLKNGWALIELDVHSPEYGKGVSITEIDGLRSPAT